MHYTDLESWLRDTNISGVRRGPVDVDEWFQGRYEVSNVLGYGHTSVVFKVIDTKLQRTAALKIWHNAGYGIDDSVLLKEGRMLANLTHPNVVKVYDYGTEGPDHRPWTILQYLGPITLYDILKEKGCLAGQWQFVASIGQQIIAIVDYLHNSAKLFQLDLKPGNLAYNPKTNMITLMDLGSAFQSKSDSFKRYGTPGYIAPEVFQGLPVTEKCDLFSLGMLFYELITGHNPLIKLQQMALDVVDDTETPKSVAISSDNISLPNADSTPLQEIEPPYNNSKQDHKPKEFVHRNSSDSTLAILIDDLPLPFPPRTDCQSKTHRERKYLDLLEDMYNIDLHKRLQELGTPPVFCEIIGALTRYNSDDRLALYEVQKSLLSRVEGQVKNRIPSIFISHSHKDKSRFVNRFSEILKLRGFKVWLDDESLRTGDPFWERIAQAIESSSFTIVILSENSLTSPGVAEEIRTAQLQSLKKTRLLPIRIDPIKFESIPKLFQSRHVLDFVGWEEQEVFQQKMEKLVADIMALYVERIREEDQKDGFGL
jgi:serine/threonine protein kinase